MAVGEYSDFRSFVVHAKSDHVKRSKQCFTARSGYYSNIANEDKKEFNINSKDNAAIISQQESLSRRRKKMALGGVKLWICTTPRCTGW